MIFYARTTDATGRTCRHAFGNSRITASQEVFRLDPRATQCTTEPARWRHGADPAGETELHLK